MVVVWTLVLVGVVVAWASATPTDSRADLVGEAVTSTTRPERTTQLRPAPTDAGPVAAPVPPRGPAFPRRIVIDSLAVDAPVVSVGLDDDGSMELPGAAEAGWYQFGAAPGDATGSAVIAAHVDYDGRPGVFVDLARLETGAVVAVVDLDGTERRFSVVERFQVEKDALPTDELFRSDGSPVLTLVTCGGAYDRRARHYDDNIVIRAVPI